MNENLADSCAKINAGVCGETDRALPTVHFSLILRVWRDAAGTIWGQVVEPLEDRRTPFRGQTMLWRLLEERIQPPADAAQSGQDERFG